MYINTQTNQYPVTERDIPEAHPDVMFPTPFVPPEGYALVFAAPQPAFDPVLQVAREIAPVLTDKGHYEQAWEVVSRFTEYTDDEGVVHTVAEQESAALAAELERLRAGMLDAVNSECQARLTVLKTGYPDGEVLSWDQQVIEARKLDADANAVTPLLSAIAAQRGIDVTTLAGRVLEKANAYAVASGSIIGARQRLEDAITAATTVDELSVIDVHAGWTA